MFFLLSFKSMLENISLLKLCRAVVSTCELLDCALIIPGVGLCPPSDRWFVPFAFWAALTRKREQVMAHQFCKRVSLSTFPESFIFIALPPIQSLPLPSCLKDQGLFSTGVSLHQHYIPAEERRGWLARRAGGVRRQLWWDSMWNWLLDGVGNCRVGQNA